MSRNPHGRPGMRTMDRHTDWKKTDKVRRTCGGLFALYGIAMVYLMFLQRTPSFDSYWDTVASSWNVVPFRTLSRMLLLLRSGELAQFAVINLVGNVIMFLPLGLMPAIWQRQRKFSVYVLTVLSLLLVVECLQLFTTLGSADVDDLILNLPGACIGFAIWKKCRKAEP